MKLRTHLVLLVVMTLLPVLALAGSLTVMLAREGRNTAERGLADTTRAFKSPSTEKFSRPNCRSSRRG
jgi:hypothetical protein